MCLLFAEIAMLFGGLYALITGKVPSRLVAGKNFKLEGTKARWVGFILMIPLPTAFTLGIIFGLIGGNDGIIIVSVVEVLLVVVAGLTAIYMVRRFGTDNRLEQEEVQIISE